MSIFLSPSRCLLAALISLSVTQAMAGPANLTLTPWAPNLKVDAVAFLPTGADRLAVSQRDGLLLLDPKGAELARLQGSLGLFHCLLYRHGKL